MTPAQIAQSAKDERDFILGIAIGGGVGSLIFGLFAFFFFWIVIRCILNDIFGWHIQPIRSEHKPDDLYEVDIDSYFSHAISMGLFFQPYHRIP